GAWRGQHGAAAADEDPRQRALEPAKDAADDRAGRSPRRHLADFTLDALAFERLGHRRPDAVGLPVDGHLVEAEREASTTVRARRLLHAAHDAAQHRAG